MISVPLSRATGNFLGVLVNTPLRHIDLTSNKNNNLDSPAHVPVAAAAAAKSHKRLLPKLVRAQQQLTQRHQVQGLSVTPAIIELYLGLGPAHLLDGVSAREQTFFWIAFNVFVAAMLAVDLGLFRTSPSDSDHRSSSVAPALRWCTM